VCLSVLQSQSSGGVRSILWFVSSDSVLAQSNPEMQEVSFSTTYFLWFFEVNCKHSAMAKEPRINVRATESQKERLRRACEVTGLSETAIVMACVEAALVYIEAHGEVRLPLAVIPKSEAGPFDPSRKRKE